MSHKITLCLSFFLVAIFAIDGSAQPQSTANKFVGTYVIGHRFGSSALTLQADGTYVMKSSDCTLEYVQSGTYTTSSEVLHFKTVTYVAKGHGSEHEINLLDPIERKAVYGRNSDGIQMDMEFELLPIRWSDRIYMIYRDDLSNFVNAVNFGLEPRSELGSEPYYGSFFLREGDQQKKVSAAPKIPDKWRSVLLSRPVVATIVALRGDEKGTLATLNKGTKSGLRVGMRLLTEDEEPSPWSRAEIVSVTTKSAIMRSSGRLMVGDKLSTKYVSRMYR
ncbi:MAG TPA: hypothetical protein VGD61_01955 [Pyrinomonadaceae bacterium]